MHQEGLWLEKGVLLASGFIFHAGVFGSWHKERVDDGIEGRFVDIDFVCTFLSTESFGGIMHLVCMRLLIVLELTLIGLRLVLGCEANWAIESTSTIRNNSWCSWSSEKKVLTEFGFMKHLNLNVRRFAPKHSWNWVSKITLCLHPSNRLYIIVGGGQTDTGTVRICVESEWHGLHRENSLVLKFCTVGSISTTISNSSAVERRITGHYWEQQCTSTRLLKVRRDWKSWNCRVVAHTGWCIKFEVTVSISDECVSHGRWHCSGCCVDLTTFGTRIYRCDRPPK